ncbi:MAG: ATP-binding protein, partial [Methanobacteriota archaeon]
LKVLAVLTAMAERVDEDHPGLFLWEDPELFMHPATLERLLNVVMNLTTNKPVQIFVTTQNLEVLAWLAESLKNTLPSEIVRTFYLQLEEGILKPKIFRGRELVGWIEFFGDPRMIGQDEMSSPLIRLLHQEEKAR